jgi:predicted transcriptional regulator
MSGKLFLRSGEDVKKAAERFIDAAERVERGENVDAETHVTFESWAGLSSVLTPKRVALLQHVHRHPEATVAHLARALGRDYKRVREDVEELAAAGLIERSPAGVRADYNEIRTTIAL